MSDKKDFFDSIDDFFTQLNEKEVSEKIHKGVNTLNKMPDKVNDALKNKGYDNIKEFLQGEFTDKKTQRPTVRPKRLRNFPSRTAFVEDALTNVQYEIKYRGYYKEGHQQALSYVKSLLPQYTYDLDRLGKRLKLEIKEIRQTHHKGKDAYTNGYLNGCEFVLKAIHQSKIVLMRQILTEMNMQNA